MSIRPRLQILFVTARYSPYIGGTEIHTHEIACRMVGHGHDVTILTADATGSLPAYEEVNGIKIQRVQAWPRNTDYYFAPGILPAMGRGTWDIIHCQGYHTFVAPLAMLAAYRSRTPYVVTFHSGGHSSRLRKALRPLQWQVLRPLLTRANKLVGVSQWEADFFQKQLRLPAENFTVIPSGSHLPKLVETSTTAKQGILIVSVGRLERYKGHHRAIEALAILNKQHPQIRLLILGTGPYGYNLQELAHKLGVANSVEIRSVDGQDRQGMAKELIQSDLVVLLSDYESQGLSVLEALSLGQPVLTSNTAALSELVEMKLVQTTPLHSSPQEIAQAIIQQLQQVATPRQNVELPTWDGCFNQLLDLYHSIL